jgi:outer membrane lipoprotein-sorting protein
MNRFRRGLALGAVFALAATNALAQAAPAAPPAADAARKAISKAAPPAKPVAPDAAAQVQKANAWFNASAIMTADFSQISPSGRRSQGQLYVQKPGKLRFSYDEPATTDIIADGTSIAIRDRKTAKQELAFLWQTPLKFLLKDKIDLAKDTKVIDVSDSPDGVSIVIEDNATMGGGTSRIKLTFDSKTFALKKWVVKDPQGYETTVTLANLDFKTRPDPDLFKINTENFN